MIIDEAGKYATRNGTIVTFPPIDGENSYENFPNYSRSILGQYKDKFGKTRGGTWVFETGLCYEVDSRGDALDSLQITRKIDPPPVTEKTRFIEVKKDLWINRSHVSSVFKYEKSMSITMMNGKSYDAPYSQKILGYLKGYISS